MTDINRSARQLINCLHQYGAKESNPVLDLLDNQHLLTNARYPDQAMGFANDHWRVFYHCHDAAGKHDSEHGHFHFFTRSPQTNEGMSDWSHVVALSVDNMGQPLQWFMVNQWVTGSAWFLHKWSGDAYTELLQAEEDTLFGAWCQAMLELYRTEITYLLKLRDKNLAFLCNSNDFSSCFQDRDIYLLAVEPILLIEKLQESLDTDIIDTSRNGNVA